MAQHPGDELIPQRRQAKPARIGRIGKGVVAGGKICQRHVEMRARARAVGERLGHPRSIIAVLAGNFADHQLQERDAIGCGQRVGMMEIDFELAVTVLVVEGIDVPAQRVHRLDDFTDIGKAIEQRGHFVTRLGERIAFAGRHGRASGIVLENVEFRFDPGLEVVAQLGGRRQLALQNAA